MLIPLIIVFGFYVHFHGEYSPGGGFQAGVVIASALILYALIFGLDAAKRAVPAYWLRVGMAMGAFIFAAVGVVTMMLGGNFLDYDLLYTEDPNSPYFHATGQHIGIIVVEVGVLMTVTCVIAAIFYAFGGHTPEIKDGDW
jgi:multicomponent Na+:H+ antiporter subunit B